MNCISQKVELQENHLHQDTVCVSWCITHWTWDLVFTVNCTVNTQKIHALWNKYSLKFTHFALGLSFSYIYFYPSFPDPMSPASPLSPFTLRCMGVQCMGTAMACIVPV